MLEHIIEALILGFFYGIGPCTITCAPLVVPMIMATAKNKREGVIFSIIFGLGRVLAYVILGILAGLLGYTLNTVIPPKILGIFIIVLGVFLIFKLDKKCIHKTKIKINGPWVSFVSGIVYGFGPCPPLVALLALAALSKSAITGGLMALVFGLATVISPIVILGFFWG